MNRLHVTRILLATAVLLWAGCDQRSRTRIVGPHDDSIAPDEPRNVYTVTGDGFVTIHWSAPQAPDVEAYAIYISVDDRDYWCVAEVSVHHRQWFLDGSRIPRSVPVQFVNGNTYWFGVTAVDRAGNESSLTTGSTTFDTPRPAGQGLRLFDVNGPRAQESGYDFSRSPYGHAMHGADLFADIYFARDAGRAWMRTAHPGVVEMQDMGWRDFDDATVGWFPEGDWHGGSSVQLSEGHVYVVRIWEETRPNNDSEPYNVGKFQVTQLDADSVTLQWAYQISPNNPELKPVSASSTPGTTKSTSPVRELHGREVQR
jgi:hypothetical protein